MVNSQQLVPTLTTNHSVGVGMEADRILYSLMMQACLTTAEQMELV